METTIEGFASGGPYMVAVITDIDAPNWDAFATELERRARFGPPRVALMLGPDCRVRGDDPNLLDLVDRFERSGVEAVIWTTERSSAECCTRQGGIDPHGVGLR